VTLLLPIHYNFKKSLRVVVLPGILTSTHQHVLVNSDVAFNLQQTMILCYSMYSKYL